MTVHTSDLDRWAEHGLISADQRDAILRFEQEQHAAELREGPGRLANGISTAGAGIAIFATAGVVSLFADSWSATQAMIAAAVAVVVMLVAAWQLVRNGWGAPAGLLAICGIIMIPLTFGFFVDAMGWWPQDDRTGMNWEQVDRERQEIIGICLLLAVLPGMLTTRLGLRQAWMLLPIAIWLGITLQFTFPFDSTSVQVYQVAYGVAVAALGAFAWQRVRMSAGSGWWLQIGGLILAGQAAAFSAFESSSGLALLGAAAAIAIFVVGVTTNRTPWMVAGALASIFPIGSLIFEYFDGIGGLVIVAIAGLLVAFLPLMILRRRTARAG
jgi:MFS family permease